MRLLEYLKINNKDEDYGDADFDAIITVCFDIEDDTPYLKTYNAFCKKLYSSVQIKNKNTVFWGNLIKNNLELFRDFAVKNWTIQYKDDDEFIYQWINELDAYCSGAGSDFIYEQMIMLLNKCKYIERKDV